MSDQHKYLLDESKLPKAWYNINADLVAGAIAGHLKAAKLILLTDVAGVLNKESKLVGSLSSNSAKGESPASRAICALVRRFGL